MFGIDFSEIVVIFVIALIVLGPAKLPKLAQTIGRWIGRARAMARQFREQLEQEANSLDIEPKIQPRNMKSSAEPPPPEDGPTSHTPEPNERGP